jgi:hypothetical protein
MFFVDTKRITCPTSTLSKFPQLGGEARGNLQQNHTFYSHLEAVSPLGLWKKFPLDYHLPILSLLGRA